MFTSYQRNIQEKKFRTHAIPVRKNFGPTKYLREKLRTHEKNFWIHEGTMARDLRDPRWYQTHVIQHTQLKLVKRIQQVFGADTHKKIGCNFVVSLKTLLSSATFPFLTTRFFHKQLIFLYQSYVAKKICQFQAESF